MRLINFFRSHKVVILLGLIVIFGLLLRLFKLSNLRLNSDEMSIGYNAYSILKTGKDEWGRKTPLIFQAFGDYKLPVYIYSAVPFIALFDLTPIGTKFPSVLSGTLLIISMYLLAVQLFRDKRVGLFSALLVAVSPWTLHLSRMALEANLALMFFSFALNLIVYQIRNPKRNFSLSIMTSILLGLTLYTYVAYKLIVAFVFLILVTATVLQKKYRAAILPIVFGLMVVFVPLMFQFVTHTGSVRFEQLQIDQQKGVEALNTERQNSCFLVDSKHYLSKVCRRVYFNLEANIQIVIKNYFSAVGTEFLFINGGKLDYLGDPGFGKFMWMLIPFYLAGMVYWFFQEKFIYRLMALFFIITPLPAALVGAPQSVRLSPMIPFIILFISFGLIQTYKHIQKNRLVGYSLLSVFILIFSFTTFQFLLHYLFVYPYQYRTSFYPLGSKFAYWLGENQNKYDKIYITNDFPDSHILLAFWQKIDPYWYQTNIKRPLPDSYGFQHPVAMGKFEFTQRMGNTLLNERLKDNSKKHDGKILYVTGATEDIQATKLFKNFSNVHIEAKVVDIDYLVGQLKKKSGLKK